MTTEATMIFERHGTEAVMGENKFTIPATETFLSVLTSNHLQDGDDFTVEQHWVHNNGKKRKAFRNGADVNCREEVLVWSRKMELDFLPIIEKKLVRMKKYQQHFYDNEYRRAIDELKKVEKAQVIRTDIPEEDMPKDKIFEYYYHSDREAWGIDWVKKTDVIINPEVGLLMFNMEKRKKDIWHRMYKFQTVFLRLISRYLMANNKDYNFLGDFAFVNINSRKYLINMRPGKYMGPEVIDFKEFTI